VITGGTRGIGAAVVKKLLEIDTKVIVGKLVIGTILGRIFD
jgi:short-subunit dehydrogenase involved in D-alanine esterification of teichoic acids